VITADRRKAGYWSEISRNVTFSSTNPIWAVVGSNKGYSVEKPVTD
jgi:hypothetical protein